MLYSFHHIFIISFLSNICSMQIFHVVVLIILPWLVVGSMVVVNFNTNDWTKSWINFKYFWWNCSERRNEHTKFFKLIKNIKLEKLTLLRKFVVALLVWWLCVHRYFHKNEFTRLFLISFIDLVHVSRFFFYSKLFISCCHLDFMCLMMFLISRSVITFWNFHRCALIWAFFEWK